MTPHEQHSEIRTIPPAGRKWSIKPEIDLGNLIAVIVLLGGFFVYAMRQEGRLVTLESGLRTEHEANQRQDADRQRQWDEIRLDLKALNDKLDRWAEKR